MAALVHVLVGTGLAVTAFARGNRPSDYATNPTCAGPADRVGPDRGDLQPQDKYDIERNGLLNLDQDDFGQNTCFPTCAAMSFAWLEAAAYGDLVPDLASKLPDYFGMMAALQTAMGWTASGGVSGPAAVRSIADYIKQRNLAGKFTITYYTEAPKDAGAAYDDLEKEKALAGSDFQMKRGGQIKAEDILKEMKAGENVLVATSKHVVDMAGMNEKKNAAGNYDVAVADPGTGQTLAGEISPDGKLKVGGKTHDIQDVIAVSPAKKK
jgi:hypothetical protein